MIEGYINKCQHSLKDKDDGGIQEEEKKVLRQVQGKNKRNEPNNKETVNQLLVEGDVNLCK